MTSSPGKSDCICAPKTCKNEAPKKGEEPKSDDWDKTLTDLTVFLSTSAELINDLKQTVQSSMQDSKPKESEPSAAQKPDGCVCKDPCDGTKKSTKSTIDLDMKILPPSDQSLSDIKASALRGKADDKIKAASSTATITLEPEYEVCKDSPFSKKKNGKEGKEAKSKSVLTDSKRHRKPISKQMMEQFIKEKNEKFSKLKDTVSVAQKNLADIQEQLRQLERLFQDYASMNTSEGQVNPAALYKEIMKPQSVPYIKPTPATPLQTSVASTCECAPFMESMSYSNTSSSIPAGSTLNQQSFVSPQEKVSVLSAVPINQASYM